MICSSDGMCLQYSVRYMTRIILEVSSDDIMILGMVNMVIRITSAGKGLLTVNYVSKQQPNTFLRVWNVLEVAQVKCSWTGILNLVLATS